jgi:hypothetical protein
VGETDKFVVIYLDDMIFLYNSDQDHLKHLRQTFIKCRKYDLYLNTKKYFFFHERG